MTEALWEGHRPRECGEHRTVGSHRAWCFDCGEWCYSRTPDMYCKGCELPGLRARLAEMAEVDAENERMGTALADARRRLAAVVVLCEEWDKYTSVSGLAGQVRAAAGSPAQPAEACPPHRYPPGMPDEVIAWAAPSAGRSSVTDIRGGGDCDR